LNSRVRPCDTKRVAYGLALQANLTTTIPMVSLSFLKTNARWLAAGFMLTLMSGFGQTYFISIFAGEIRETFDLSHGEWGGIYTLGTGASAAVMVWAGALTDKYRIRTLAMAILPLLMVACFFMAGFWAVWMLPIVIFSLRFAGQGMISHLAVVAMSRWFVAARGRALSIAGLGYSVGEAFLPMLFVSLLVLFDWRILWVVAGFAAILGLPVLLGLLRSERTPQSFAESDQSLGMKARHWTRGEAIRHPLFWMMFPALLGPSAFGTSFFFHQVHFAELKALSHFELVALFPVYTGGSIVMMVASGWLLDKFGTPRLIPWYQVPLGIGFVIFGLTGSLTGIIIGILFFAATSGANATLPNAFWAEFYGTKNLGSIKALATAIMVLGSAIGPGITGYLIDFGVGLETQFVWVGGYFAIATAMMVVGINRAKTSLSATT